MKKKIKKATIALIVVSSVLGAAVTVFVIGASVWANKPRGVRVHLDEDK